MLACVESDENNRSIALPLDQRLWDDLFHEAKKWGLEMYEQDWLDVQYLMMKYGSNRPRFFFECRNPFAALLAPTSPRPRPGCAKCQAEPKKMGFSSSTAWLCPGKF